MLEDGLFVFHEGPVPQRHTNEDLVQRFMSFIPFAQRAAFANAINDPLAGVTVPAETVVPETSEPHLTYARTSSHPRRPGQGHGVWISYSDESTKHYYYFNPMTQETTWTLPQGAACVPENSTAAETLLVSSYAKRQNLQQATSGSRQDLQQATSGSLGSQGSTRAGLGSHATKDAASLPLAPGHMNLMAPTRMPVSSKRKASVDLQQTPASSARASGPDLQTTMRTTTPPRLQQNGASSSSSTRQWFSVGREAQAKRSSTSPAKPARRISSVTAVREGLSSVTAVREAYKKRDPTWGLAARETESTRGHPRADSKEIL